MDAETRTDPETSNAAIARGCMPVVLITLLLVGGAFAFVAWRAGGPSQIQNVYLVNAALNLLETHALDQRPDGVAESEVQATFAGARAAVTDRRVDLAGLYVVLRSYEERFKGTGTKPSNGEMQQFLSELDATVLPLSDVR
jgi:hypothetical protein